MGDVWLEFDIGPKPRDFIREAHRQGITWPVACYDWILDHRPRNPRVDLQARMEERLSQEIDLCRDEVCNLLNGQGEARAVAWCRDMVTTDQDRLCITEINTGVDGLPVEILFMGGTKVIRVGSGDSVRWKRA